MVAVADRGRGVIRDGRFSFSLCGAALQVPLIGLNSYGIPVFKGAGTVPRPATCGRDGFILIEIDYGGAHARDFSHELAPLALKRATKSGSL